MSDEYRDILKIPKNHLFTCISSTSSCKRGQDTDIYIYEERDENGHIINCYEIKDSTSIHPPQTRRINHTKIS